MAHLHNETVDGKNIVFYTDDNGVIWIRAYTLFHVAGIKSPGATLRSYIINHPGVGQKFSYPDNATGVAYLAPPAKPAKPAKAKAVPDTSNPLAATYEWLTGLLEDTSLPYALHLQALKARAELLDIQAQLAGGDDA